MGNGGDLAKRNALRPHYGGHMGLMALLCMLGVTGCMAFAENTGATSFLPGWAQTTSYSEPTDATLVSANAATFIVRFNNEPELQQVSRNFRRDEAATREVFRKWAAQYPQLEGLELVRASYSGELILGLPVNDPAGRSPKDVIAALETMSNLAYAEIDSMATASERK